MKPFDQEMRERAEAYADNDNLPASPYNACARKAFGFGATAALTSELVLAMRDALVEIRSAEMRAFGSLGVGKSPHSIAAMLADDVLDAYERASSGRGE